MGRKNRKQWDRRRKQEAGKLLNKAEVEAEPIDPSNKRE
jgi:hypothetical protein